jgi:hypothetical protein
MPAYRQDPDISRVSPDMVRNVLDISANKMGRYLRARVIPPPEHRNKYDLMKVVHAYIKYLQYGSSGNNAFDAKRALLEEKFKEAKLENDVREKKLVDIDDVENAFVQAMVTIASQLDALPGRLAAELSGITDQAIILQRLKNEITLIRRAGQEHLQAFLGHPPRERDIETPAEEDARRVGRRKARIAARKSRARAMEEPTDSLHGADRPSLRKSVLPKNHRGDGLSDGEDRQSSKRDRSSNRRRPGARLVRRANKE